MSKTFQLGSVVFLTSVLFACQEKTADTHTPFSTTTENAVTTVAQEKSQPGHEPQFASQPLVDHIFTADPSAHVFNGRLYIYPSHDIKTDIATSGEGDRFDMKDYHVLSMDVVGGEVTDHGVALALEDVPWASRQLWAPDAAEKAGKYYLYFPAKDQQGIFRIGVAASDSPSGPFTAEPTPIKGSYSIDPAVFKDTDGSYYLYVGGIWGGQLQRWSSGSYQTSDQYPADDQPALMPKIARLDESMLNLAEDLKDVQLLDQQGQPLLASDTKRRFFEAAWVHKYNGRYYFSYSTGDTHNIAYAVGDSPYGPFTYQGIILEPVLGWTNHHSIVEFNGKWYLFYHDSQLSGGKTHLRNVKVTELTHHADGSIQTLSAFKK